MAARERWRPGERPHIQTTSKHAAPCFRSQHVHPFLGAAGELLSRPLVSESIEKRVRAFPAASMCEQYTIGKDTFADDLECLDEFADS